MSGVLEQTRICQVRHFLRRRRRKGAATRSCPTSGHSSLHEKGGRHSRRCFSRQTGQIKIYLSCDMDKKFKH